MRVTLRKTYHSGLRTYFLSTLSHHQNASFCSSVGLERERNRSSLSLVQTHHLEVDLPIIRPIHLLKENVVIANLMTRYKLIRSQPHSPLPLLPPASQNHHILINSDEVTSIPLPHCTTKIVFTTSFMEEIIEQQSQTNPIILKWNDGPLAIAGKISRP